MSNDVIIEAWNTVLFDKFSKFKYLFMEGYPAISEAAFTRNRLPAGVSILDVGCGFGDCTIRIAERVGDEGQRLKGDLLIALQEVIAKFEREDGSFWAPSSAWFVTAHNPV